MSDKFPNALAGYFGLYLTHNGTRYTKIPVIGWTSAGLPVCPGKNVFPSVLQYPDGRVQDLHTSEVFSNFGHWLKHCGPVVQDGAQ